MTDEERQSLLKDLHGISHDEEGVDDYVAERCLAAADEIERLANAEEIWKGRAAAYLKIANDEAALAQSDAEPGTSAGLIEAAEYLKCYANDYMKNWINDGEVAETLLRTSEHLRARAATDRSGK